MADLEKEGEHPGAIQFRDGGKPPERQKPLNHLAEGDLAELLETFVGFLGARRAKRDLQALGVLLRDAERLDTRSEPPLSGCHRHLAILVLPRPWLLKQFGHP